MKVVIYTQIRENYGAHDWDGEGECPQYWKFKGGATYVVHGVSVEEAQSAEWWDTLYASIESRNESFEEYIIAADPVDDVDYDESKVCEEWDSPIELREVTTGDFRATRYTTNEFSAHSGIVAKMERWVQVGGKREKYLLMYELESGDLISHRDWVDQQEAA